MSNEQIGLAAAAAFREDYGLGLGPIASMPRLLEQKVGIGVAYVTLPTSPGHGMTMRLGEKYMIAAGCTDHPMRLRSTLAHELGHFRLGSVDRALGHEEWDKRTPEEIQADAFARHLLVPLDAVRAATRGVPATIALLSDLVQTYQASPSIVAIQLREAGEIDPDTCDAWKTFTAAGLASRFGWHAEYAALAAHSTTPRAPQALLARAVEGYRWNLITPAAIARLDGQRDPRDVVAELHADGIAPVDVEDVAPERPADAGTPLTAEEIAYLLGDGD